jgi:hypothetical protein
MSGSATSLPGWSPSTKLMAYKAVAAERIEVGRGASHQATSQMSDAHPKRSSDGAAGMRPSLAALRG